MRFYFYRNWRKYNAAVYAPSVPGGDYGFAPCGNLSNGFIHTWTVPLDVRFIDVFLVGRGGAAVNGSSSNRAGGGGGYTKTLKANSLTVDAGGWVKDGGPIAVTPGETLYLGMRASSAYLSSGGNQIPLATCIGRNFIVSTNSYTAAPSDILASVDCGGAAVLGSSTANTHGGPGGSGGAVVSGLGGSDGANGASYPQSTSNNGGIGQHHTTRPFAEDGSWASTLNLPLFMNVPYGAGGGEYAAVNGALATAQHGGGGQNFMAIEGYGGGEGFYNSSPAYGCIIVRWLI